MPASLKVEAEGVRETVRAFSGIEKDLRKEANAELRAGAKKAAAELVTRLVSAAGSSPTPQARLLADTVKVKSDRFPTVTIGGTKKVGRHGTPAARLQWGSERGGANFGAPAGGSYWIAPTVAAYATSGAIAVFRRSLFELSRRYGVAA